MQQMTTIEETLPVLVPVDFSAATNESLLLAAQQADCSSQPLVVLHVAHDNACRPNIYLRRNEQEQMLPIEEIAEKMLHDLMDKMREQHPDSVVLAKARLIVVSGLPANRILEIARQIDAGLIVMGGNGRSSLSKLIGGSVSEKVVSQSPVPVTIIHSNRAVLEHGRNEVRRAGEEEPSRVSVGLG
jgi:nucleotide-binding universal stress UspA family protein